MPAVDPIHEAGRAGDDADRHAAADDLSVRREVGPDAEPLLRAARRDAEAGDRLVEHQGGADLARHRAQVAQELARLQIGTAALYRLGEDRRQLTGVRADHVERFGPSVVEDEQVLGDRRRDPDHRRDRRAVPEPRAHREHAVGVPVVRAGEQRDLAAAGLRAREPQRGHDGFGAGVRESDALHARRRGDELGHLAGEV